MTAPPQPRRKHVTDDLDLGVSGNQVPVASSKRQAINDRQRAAAEADEEYAKFLDNLHHDVWPDWGKS